MMRNATRKEVLLAISMSQLTRRGHILFMPVGKNYVRTLRRLRGLGFISSTGKDYYELTEKGLNQLKLYNSEVKFKAMDDEIDGFVDAI